MCYKLVTKSAELKQAFWNHFIAWGHVPIESFSVKSNRSGLLFNNSGMAPLYNVFSGGAVSATPLCSIQKCIRLGGKHNDYSNIGTSNRHLSFFEMMGGFSFGSYNKLYAMQLVWEFLLRLGLDVNKLVITVHATDVDTFMLWKGVVGANQVVLASYGEQNVWKVGDFGLCGACTEIYYISGSSMWEVLNVVFITHNQHRDMCKKLALSCIDIGAGLERILAVLDGSFDVYSTDEFRSVAEDVWPGRKLAATDKLLLDHTRCASVIIADGVVPSNIGAGYVLRKLIRRCVTELLATNRDLNVLNVLVERFVDARAGSQNKFVLDVVFSEIKACLNSLSANIVMLKNRSLAAHHYNTFGIPKKLLQVLAPNLFKPSKLATTVYYSKHIVLATIILEQGNSLVLNKTCLAPAIAGQIGDQGIIVGAKFGFITNHEVIDSSRLHVLQFASTYASLLSARAYVIKNVSLATLCSQHHSSLHLLTGAVRSNFSFVKIAFTRVSYVGFVVDLCHNELPNLKQLIDNTLDRQFNQINISCWYTKHATGLTKLVNIEAFGLCFVEACCGTHAMFVVCQKQRRAFKQLSANKLRVEVGAPSASFSLASAPQQLVLTDKTQISSRKLSLAPVSFSQRFCLLSWPHVIFNSRRLETNFSIYANLSEKTIRCLFSTIAAIPTAAQKLPIVDSNYKEALIQFASHSELHCGLIFLKSVLLC
ncbi:MAG: alanine--tRNA ligase-related protein [Candidatus Hodgkinia cicadicola]